MKVGNKLDWDRELNPEQRKIVSHTDGPILVVAGAGSGKTRVITYKIAYLILEKNIPTNRILILTFTNKAANEMIERIRGFKSLNCEGIWIGTFHSIFCKILRREAKLAGYKSNFNIYDENDQLNVIREIMGKFGYTDKNVMAKAICKKIDYAKNHLISPEEYVVNEQDKYDIVVKSVFNEYEKFLKSQNTVDFNDLLIKPIEIFNAKPLVLKKYQNKFRYILVDEFQDTNLAQYQLLSLVSRKHNNICVVGDDDQSIYGWRGAEISNIMNFDGDFGDVKIFKLERNYRSTKNILELAQSLVKNNKNRRAKILKTSKEEGEKISLKILKDEKEEAFWISQSIKEEIFKKKKRLSDFAVLYRTNAQSRILEEGFYKASIPYIVVGGIRFYARKEIKDILAYLRVISNPDDEINLKRIINYPLRGIGKTTLSRIEEITKEKKVGLYRGIKLEIKSKTLSERSRENLKVFYTLIEKYRSMINKISLSELVRTLIEEVGISTLFRKEGTQESLGRWENVLEFLSAISDYSKQKDDKSLDGFLKKVSLFTDIDGWNDKQDAVTFMTVHNAKGLEFSSVFITGLEEGLFPLYSYMNNEDEIEEERRLFYVGATRAIDKLYLSYALRRMRFGEVKNTECSRFLREIDMSFIDSEAKPVKIRGKKPRKKLYSTDEKFKSGGLVLHEIFGTGRIIETEGKGESMKILVNFDAVGDKKLVVKYANLKILN
ncbi:ATP-dependent helicase [candidate division KSB1 bacterium]